MRDSWRKHHGYGAWGTSQRKAESSAQQHSPPRQRPFHNPTPHWSHFTAPPRLEVISQAHPELKSFHSPTPHWIHNPTPPWSHFTIPLRTEIISHSYPALKSKSCMCQSDICLWITKATAKGVPISPPSHLTPTPIHINILQKPTLYYTAIIIQLKIN